MNKLVAGTGAVLAAGLVVLGLAMAPAAAAAETGPDSVACANANAAVLAAALAANAEAEKVGDAQDVVLVGLKAAVKEASDKVDAANTLYQAKAKVVSDAGDAATAAEKQAAADALKALVAAQNDLKTAVNNLAAGPQLTPAQKTALDAANANVAEAIKRRSSACEFVVVTPTVTPTVTPPLFADCAAVRAAGKSPLGRDENGYRAALDSDGDGQACEAIEGRLPTGINTGLG